MRQVSVQRGQTPTRSEHRKHDRLLVTRYAMDDSYPGERDEARSLVDSCPDCAALAADIRTIADSMTSLPVPKRTRDFTITQEQADQLHGNRLSRWFRGLAMPGWGTLRPVAGVALSIGLVMAVVGMSVPSTTPAADSGAGITALGSSTPAPAAAPPELQAPQPTSAQVPEIAPTSTDTGGPEGPAVAEVDKASQDPTTEQLDQAYLAASPATDAGAQGDGTARSASSDTTGNLLLYGGLAIAALSAALLALAWIARRYFADPLLR